MHVDIKKFDKYLEYNPDRTILTLSFEKKQAEKASRNGQTAKTVENKKQIVAYIAKNGAAGMVRVRRA